MNKQIWLLASLQAARAQLRDPTLRLTATERYAIRDEVNGCLLALRGWRDHPVPPSTETAA
jgi:hypothetical protein